MIDRDSVDVLRRTQEIEQAKEEQRHADQGMPPGPYPLYRPVHCAWCGRKLENRESATNFTVWCKHLECWKHDFPFRYPQIDTDLKEAA